LHTIGTDYGGKTRRNQAALLFGGIEQLAKLQHLANALDCSISDAVAFASTETCDAPDLNFDLLLIDLQSDLDVPTQQLSKISDYLNGSNAEAMVWTNRQTLETAYAMLPVSRCHFLIDPTDAEVVLIMSGAIRRGKMDQVHGGNREVEFSALHRISDELADFAKTLARIAEQDEDAVMIGLAEKPISFRPAPAAIMHPFIEAPAAQASLISPALIREAIKLRRLRDSYFQADLFADPAWDILLDLFAARLEGISVSVSSLCIAAAVPATTALRWVTGMTTSGILLRRHDPKDARRVFIELSNETAAQMTTYFSEMKRRSNQLLPML
jgi:hypothetical protein